MAINAGEYIHSSARFDITDKEGIYAITNLMEMEEADFTGFVGVSEHPQRPRPG